MSASHQDFAWRAGVEAAIHGQNHPVSPFRIGTLEDAKWREGWEFAHKFMYLLRFVRKET